MSGWPRPAVLGLAFAAGLVGLPAAALAQQASPGAQASIADLVAVYQSGAYERAVAAASAWSDERVAREVAWLLSEDERSRSAGQEARVLPSLDVVGAERGSRERARERAARRLAAAAMLAESSLALLVRGGVAPLAPRLETTQKLLEWEPGGPADPAFAQRFDLLAGLVLHWHVELTDGSRLLGRALQLYPDDAELHTALGSMLETVASLRSYPEPPDSRRPTAASTRYSSERGPGGDLPGATLAEARAQYERALTADPGLEEARLRLGHVLALSGQPESALPLLERVAEATRQERQRYLALLFAGQARQQLGDPAGAVASFRACLAHGPRAQTVQLALAHSLGQLGDTAGVQQALAEVGRRGAPYDPWWTYGGGQPDRFEELVAQLREQVAVRPRP